MTRSEIVFEKVAAFFILLILPLYVAAVIFDPGFEGKQEYTSGNLSRLLTDQGEFRVSVALMSATALAAFAAGGWVVHAFSFGRAAVGDWKCSRDTGQRVPLACSSWRRGQDRSTGDRVADAGWSCRSPSGEVRVYHRADSVHDCRPGCGDLVS